MRALIFIRPESTSAHVYFEILWYFNTSLVTAQIFFSTHRPEDVGLWLWENDAFRRLTRNELQTFAQTGVVRNRCRCVFSPGVLRTNAPRVPTRCTRDADHDGDCDFDGYNHDAYLRERARSQETDEET